MPFLCENQIYPAQLKMRRAHNRYLYLGTRTSPRALNRALYQTSDASNLAEIVRRHQMR